MSHDLIAELDGYRTEAAGYERSGRADRAAAVREHIDRVTKQIGAEADKLIAQAENHEEAGQDLLAAQARVEARRLRRVLDDGRADAADGPPAERTAAESAPRETATPKRRGSDRGKEA